MKKFILLIFLSLYSWFSWAQPSNQTNIYIFPPSKQEPTKDKPKRECIDYFGSQVCGYHCVKSTTSAQCAPTPEQSCIIGSYGNIACGYGCVKSFDRVQCAQVRGQSCVADNFGHIECGYDCKAGINVLACAHYEGDNCVLSPFGSIKCGKNCLLKDNNPVCEQER